MKKLTCSAIALTMTCAAGFASDSEWSALDQEVGALTSSLLRDGATLSGRVSSSYTSESGANIGGFDAYDARLAVSGTSGDFGYRIEVDFAGETFSTNEADDLDTDHDESENTVDDSLLDAYATWSLGNIDAQMGRFRASVCSDASADEGSMDHIAHSLIGQAFTRRSEGLGLSGAMDQFGWSLGIMNGSDGTGDELETVIRVSFDPMDGTSVSIAIVDDGDDDSGATVVELDFAMAEFGINIVQADVEGGGSGNSLGDNLEANSTPITIGVTYQFNADWMIAVRMTDFDNTAGTERQEITANHGNWQIGMTVDSDDMGLDRDTLQVALHVGF
jgi:hypothetical protein